MLTDGEAICGLQVTSVPILRRSMPAEAMKYIVAFLQKEDQ